MDEREAVVSELEAMRERATALLNAKLQAVASQVREAAARTVGELEVVLPPDLEALFPLGPIVEMMPERPSAAAAVDLEAVRRLDGGRAQSELLQELLRQLEPFCGGRAILVFRDGQVSGWASMGFARDEAVRGWRGALADSPALTQAAEGTPARLSASADGLLGGWLGDADVLAVPMTLRGKIVGALLAVDAGGRLAAEMVQLFVYMSGLMMETMSVRPPGPSPSLKQAVVISSGAEPAADAEAEPAFAVSTPAEEEPAPVEENTTPPAGQSEVDASATVQLKVPPTTGAPARSADEDRRHEEARRFARLLVSEIRLYNEQAVQDGKNTHDIYERLKEDIDRSREMYEQRVPAEVRASSNYFFEELVRILADGDPDALGL